jgi:hypothetical protein
VAGNIRILVGVRSKRRVFRRGVGSTAPLRTKRDWDARYRNIWDDPRTLAAQKLAYKGLTIRTIARFCLLSTGQVEYRLRRIGISTTEWRRGTSEKVQAFAEGVLRRHGLPYAKAKVTQHA